MKCSAASSASNALVCMVDTASGEEAVLVVTLRQLCAGEGMLSTRGGGRFNNPSVVWCGVCAGVIEAGISEGASAGVSVCM